MAFWLWSLRSVPPRGVLPLQEIHARDLLKKFGHEVRKLDAEAHAKISNGGKKKQQSGRDSHGFGC